VAEVLDARRVPFVFVTSYGREALPPLFCGRPHLGKPFAPGELIGTVARLIAPAAEAEAWTRRSNVTSPSFAGKQLRWMVGAEHLF